MTGQLHLEGTCWYAKAISQNKWVLDMRGHLCIGMCVQDSALPQVWEA